MCLEKRSEVNDMGLAGTVVKTAGKGAIGGAKVLAKGTGKVAGGTLNLAGKGLSGIGKGLSNSVDKIGSKSNAKSASGILSSGNRGAQAESMMHRVVREADTTGLTSDGYGY